MNITLNPKALVEMLVDFLHLDSDVADRTVTHIGGFWCLNFGRRLRQIVVKFIVNENNVIVVAVVFPLD